jgi:hypothetical protein
LRHTLWSVSVLLLSNLWHNCPFRGTCVCCILAVLQTVSV